MNVPKVSVLMPVYNGEKYLKEAIDSILSQTFTDFEFIIINDGSTDKTEEIIKSYSDDRIIYYSNEKNEGLIYTLNKGIDLSRGEYIARMDGDDISLPERIYAQVEFMDANPIYGVCCTNAVSINEFGDQIQGPWWNADFELPIEWLLLFQNPMIHPATIIRKSVLKDNNIYYSFDSYNAEDYELWTRLSVKTKFYRLNAVLFKYRVLENSAYHSNIDISLNNSLRSNIKLLQVLTDESTPNFHKYLTVFCREKTDFVEVDDLTRWINKLILILSKKWNWDKKQLKAVEANSKKIVFNFYSRLDKTVLVKNAFRLHGLGIFFYMRMSYLFFKFICKKITF